MLKPDDYPMINEATDGLGVCTNAVEIMGASDKTKEYGDGADSSGCSKPKNEASPTGGGSTMADRIGIYDKLENARRDLLDLTKRNQLISTPRSRIRSGYLEIVDELSEEIFRIMGQDKNAMTFLSGLQDGNNDDGHAVETGLFPQPDDNEGEESSGPAARHSDTELQTTLTSKQLQRKLLKLSRDARTSEEDQGVNTLYLAIGFLKWFEDDNSDIERFAPLLLLPVQLDRKSANARFRLSYTEDDVTTNLSLQEKLMADFGLRLPEVTDVEELSPEAYFAEVRKAITTRPRWQVLNNDMVLGSFSFSKFLMYRDLQPDTWAGEHQMKDHPLVAALLQDGFRQEPSICPEDENIDGFLQPLDMIHVMDADSSQAIAIEEVRQGRNLVIQGPPGTGKSQTITNLIATAVKEGKKVLFVAEKMAALEVVKERLDSVGLGDMCLELHSHKAKKRVVLEELERTLDLGCPKLDDVVRQAEDLQTYRDKLNHHAKILHSYLEPAHVTPFQALGELVRLKAEGVEPADFQLADALSWSTADFREKQNMLEDLATHMREVGEPRQHPWRGVQLQAVLPTDVDRIVSTLPGILARIDRVIVTSKKLAEIVHYGIVETPMDCSMVAEVGKWLVKAPPMDKQAIGNSSWSEQRGAVSELLAMGVTLEESTRKLDETVAEVAWTTDVSIARRYLAAYGRSWFRLFNGDYRRALATLRGILLDELPKSLKQRLGILDRLIKGQRAHQTLKDSQHHQLGQAAFGSNWRGVDSDWSTLGKVTEWESECRQADLPDNFHNVLADIDDLVAVDELVKNIAGDLKPLIAEIQQLFKQLDLDLHQAFGTKDLRAISLTELQSRLQSWRDDPEAVTKWIAYITRWRRLKEHGMGPLAEKLDQSVIPAVESPKRFEMAYFEDLMREAFRRHPDLASFDGASHEQLLKKFKDLDLERIALAGKEVALAHYQGLPTQGGDAGEVGVLRREMKKKRKHLPLRKLLREAGHAIQAVKPVFMMSPISIAQYLEPGVLEFDLLLIDEASQVRPVDALGAVARVWQMVVVGDDRQLPPTRFFSRDVGDDGEATEDEDFRAGDMESILGLCEAQNMPRKMLQWHYRSRHHSLIAVSNREFYNDRLYVVPSPFNGQGDLGLRFRHIADGVFDRGGSRTNRNEAIAIADAVMEHARLYPDKTLGVGAFSVSQRDAILNELELRRRQTSELEAFFGTAKTEPFFVKNLENIQGDERDVILISIGYGKDSSGYMAMAFGPLSNEGGERRLNVLITRARERCEVFSSIMPEDIDLNCTKARGVQALKTYLTYARSGFLDAVATATGSFDSEFERQVAQALVTQGFQVDAQIGVAGFRIDLGIVDPDQPGRYLLGIECDGATYHSSRSARDRDRIRQQVLEDRDWIIHRIWSTDWFLRPEEQLRKVVASVEVAKATWASRSRGGEQAHCDKLSTPAIESIDRHDSDSEDHAPPEAIDRHDLEPHDSEPHDHAPPETIAAVPYVEANLIVDRCGVHDIDVTGVAKIVTEIIRIEGPVHQDEVVRRVATLWGLAPAESRIAGAVERALDEAVCRSQVVRHGLFYCLNNHSDIPIRNRENVQSTNLRKPDYLPPAEIREALAAVVRTHWGMTSDEAAMEVARLFGLSSICSQFKQIIQDEISTLVEQNVLDPRNGILNINDAAAVAEPV